MGRIREYATGGKRFYVIDVRGYTINAGRSGAGDAGKVELTTFAVLDRDDMHREVAVFTPTYGPRNTEWCRRRAEETASRLNAEVVSGTAA
jgi:hypothetical protein